MGERKQATALFADIVGSTQLIAGLDAEQAMERLRPSVRRMCVAAQQFGGTVMRILGDGVMVLFGAPRAQEGHALLACQAAVEMQKSVQLGNDAVKIRIGLHSGEVILHEPTELHELVPHGAALHLASRMEQMAAPGEICLTQDCYRLIRWHYEVCSLGTRAIKGFSQPIEVYRLLSLKTTGRTQQFRATALATLQGRQAELALLQEALRDAEGGNARVIGIAGAAGTGKSRLCYEFAQWCHRRSIPVLEGRAQTYGRSTPLQPVLQFLRNVFRISPRDEPAKARARISDRLAPAFDADKPLLFEFLGLHTGQSALPTIEPKVRRRRLLDLTRRLVRHRGQATSVVILEDLHWLDEASEEFVSAFVDAVKATQILLIVNYRSGYSAPWMKGPYFREIALAELSAADTDALVAELTGTRAELSQIRARIAERSNGNPFFVEELVHTLVEGGKLGGNQGDLVAGQATVDSLLPPTLQAVIGERIDRLADAEKAVTQVAAIIGKDFPAELIEKALRFPPKDLDALLLELSQKDVIALRASTGERLYTFRHPLIQEVAYAAQPRARRTDLHLSIAFAMESYYKERLDEFAGLLAHHFEAAERPLHAGRYIRRAAAWIGTTNSSQAIKHWLHLCRLLKSIPRTDDSDRLCLEANGQVVVLGWREGMTLHEAKPFIEEALLLARQVPDKAMTQLLLAARARMAVADGGSADDYVAQIKDALALQTKEASPGRAAFLNAFLTQAYRMSGMLREALAANDEAQRGLSHIEKSDEQFVGFNIEQWILSQRGRILVWLGRFEEAEKYFEAIIAQNPVDPAIRVIPHNGFVTLAWCRGDGLSALRHSKYLAEIAHNSGTPYVQFFALFSASIAKSINNELADAVAGFTQCLDFVRTSKTTLEYEAEIQAHLAYCLHQLGNSQQAVAIAREAIGLAQRRGARLAECLATIAYGSAFRDLNGGRPSCEVEKMYRRADALVRLTGAIALRPLLGREISPMVISAPEA